MCARCEELEEEVAYLRKQLGLEVDAAGVARLSRELGLTPTSAAIVAALFNAGNRPLNWQALDALVPESKCPERQNPSNQVQVMVWRVRRVLGRDAIVNFWGQGFTLSPETRSRIAAVLRPQAEAA